MQQIEQKYFKLEDKFLKWIEEEHNRIYSVLRVDISKTIDPKIFKDKKGSVVLTYSRMMDGAEILSDAIYQHNSGFYIYLSKSDDTEISFQSKIYYKQEQHDEVIMFVNSIKKQ